MSYCRLTAGCRQQISEGRFLGFFVPLISTPYNLETENMLGFFLCICGLYMDFYHADTGPYFYFTIVHLWVEYNSPISPQV